MLLRRWGRARQGEGQLVLIAGGPGLGESRLIEEFHARLRDTPHTWVDGVVRGFCRARRCIRSPMGPPSGTGAPMCPSRSVRGFEYTGPDEADPHENLHCWLHCSTFRCRRTAPCLPSEELRRLQLWR